MARSINEIISRFKIEGIEGEKANMKALIALLERVGFKTGSGFKEARKNISEVSKELGVTEQSLKDILTASTAAIQKLRALGQTNAGQKFGQTVKRSSVSIPKDEERLKQRNLRNQFRKAKVADLEGGGPKITQDTANNIAKFNSELDRSFERIKDIDNVSVRVKTSTELLVRLEKELAKLTANTKDEIFKKEQVTKKVLGLARKLEGIEKKSGGKVSQKSLDGLENKTRGIKNIAASSEDAANAERRLGKNAKGASDRINKLDQSIGIAIGKLIRYRVAFFALRGAIRGVKAAINDFIETQFKLAELEIVIDRQVDSIERYRKAAIRLSKDFGSAITDIVEVMKVWAQTGLQQNDVLAATEATLIGVNALGATTTEVVEALTAAIFTYGVASEDLTIVISKWLAVQREFPVSAIDLANSLKVVGAAAQVVGVDLDDLAGFVAAIGSSTRKSGAAVGQTLKTIFARLPRKEVIKVFEQLDIAVLKNATELRDLDNILDDLQPKWDTLNTVTKANLATTLGGIRRYSDFIALMDNYEVKVRAVIEAQKASTESLDANQIILGTTQKAFEQAKATLQEFSISLGQNLVGPITKLVQAFKGIGEFFGGFNGIVSKLISTLVAFTAVSSGVAIVGISIRAAWNKVLFTLATMGKVTKDTTFSLKFVENAARSAALAFNELQASANGANLTMSVGTKIIGGIALAAAALAAIWFLVSDGASTASSSIGGFVESTEQALKNTRQLISANEKEIQQINRIIDSIDKFTTKLSSGLTGKKLNEQIDKLQQSFAGLPKTQTDINLALIKINSTTDITKETFKDLTEILKEYSGQIGVTSKKLKELEKDQRQELITETKARQRKIKDDSERLVALKSSINNEIDNSEFDLSKITFRAFGNAKQDRVVTSNIKDLLKLFTKEGQKSFSSIKIDKIFNRFTDAVVKEFSSSIDFVNEKIKEIAPIELEPDLIINKGTIRKEATVLTFFLKDLLNKTSIEDLQSVEGRTIFENKVNRLLETRGDIIRKNITLSISLGNKINKFTEESLVLSKTLRDIDKIDNPDAQTFVGQKQNKEVASLGRNLNDIISSFKTLRGQFKNQVDIKAFDKFLDFKDFETSKSVDAVKALDKEFSKISKTINNYTEDINNLTEASSILEGKKGPFSDLKEGDIIKISNLLEDLGNITIDAGSGTKKPQEDVANLLKERKKAKAELIKLLNSPEALNLRSLLVKNRQITNSLDKESLFLRKQINKETELSLNIFDGQSKIVRTISNNTNDLVNIEKERLKIITSGNIKAASTSISFAERRNDLEKALNKNLLESRKTLKKIADIRLDKIASIAVDNIQSFRDTLKDAFNQIPDNIIQGEEKRKSLTEDIRKLEFDLNEVRAEGDAQAIATAEFRLREAQKELDANKRIISELGKLAGGILTGISDQFRKNLVDKVTQALTSISIGGKRLDELVGDAISVGSGQLNEGWRKAAREVNSDYFVSLKEVLNKHVSDLKELFSETVKGPPKEVIKQSKSSKILQDRNLSSFGPEFGPVFTSDNESTTEAINKNTEEVRKAAEQSNKDSSDIIRASNGKLQLIDSSLQDGTDKSEQIGNALRASVALVATTIASSLFPTKGGQVGSNIGGLTGGAIGARLGKAGGPIGTVVGSILGGVIGNIFGGKDDSREPLISATVGLTEATISNTIALKELDKAIFNAPTRFSGFAQTPSFGNSVSVQVNITSDNPQQVSDAVVQAINDAFDDSERTSGTRGFVPI